MKSVIIKVDFLANPYFYEHRIESRKSRIYRRTDLSHNYSENTIFDILSCVFAFFTLLNIAQIHKNPQSRRHYSSFSFTCNVDTTFRLWYTFEACWFKELELRNTRNFLWNEKKKAMKHARRISCTCLRRSKPSETHSKVKLLGDFIIEITGIFETSRSEARKIEALDRPG